jgi:hypothetical protein
MQRDRWQFEFSAAKLQTAARAKKVHHEKRLNFWEEAKGKVMVDVKETGIEISESEAGSSYQNSSRAYEPQVMVRADLQTRLSECHGKILEHAKKVRELEGWIQFFGARPDAMLPLNADDYLFFFGE